MSASCGVAESAAETLILSEYDARKYLISLTMPV